MTLYHFAGVSFGHFQKALGKMQTVTVQNAGATCLETEFWF
jgi:hypothetical protein